MVAVIGIGLQHARPARKMCAWMLAAAIARVVEHRGRWRTATEGTIVAHVDPASPGIGMTFSEHGYGGVVAVQSLGSKNMALDTTEQRLQYGAASAY